MDLRFLGQILVNCATGVSMEGAIDKVAKCLGQRFLVISWKKAVKGGVNGGLMAKIPNNRTSNFWAPT